MTPKREGVGRGDASGCVREVENVVPLQNWALWDERFSRYGCLKSFGAVDRAVTSLAIVFADCGQTEGCGRLMMIPVASSWSQDSVGPPTL